MMLAIVAIEINLKKAKIILMVNNAIKTNSSVRKSSQYISTNLESNDSAGDVFQVIYNSRILQQYYINRPNQRQN